MLRVFRSGTSSKILFGFLGLALFAMVVTGFGTGGMGIGGMGTASDRLASVGGEALTSTEVAEQVSRQFDAARGQQPALDISTFIGSGAYEEIIRQMIASKAVSAFAAEHGMGASQRMVDGQIAGIPAFQNLAGKFDDATFRRALQAERITEEQLREELAASLIQRQILLPVAASTRVPQALATQYAALLLETRSGEVAFVPASAVGAGGEPTDAEVEAFYKRQQARYTVPERRVLRYATFGPEAVAAAATPTAAEIEAFYRANAASYGPTQTRTLSQVVLPDQAAARAFSAKVASGTSFQQAAQQAGFSASDIQVGSRTREAFADLTSDAVANAAFSAAQGAVTAPTQSDFGWHVVRVDAIETTPAKPLQAVRGEIEEQLRAQKQQDALSDLVTRIEDAIADGSTFDEVVRAEKLTATQTPPITATGAVLGAPTQAPADLGPLLRPGFEMAADEDPVVETVQPGQRFALLAVGQVIPAAPAPIAQIREEVKADLVRERASARARAVAAAIETKVNAGTPLADAVAQADVRLPAVEQVKAQRLDIARQNQQVPPPMAMMFSLPRGKARLMEAPGGAGWYVVHLTGVTPGDPSTNPALVQATRTQFARITGDEYAEQFSNAIERQLEVERDEAAIARLKEQLRTGAAR